jgi:hypothetical protein
MLVILPVMEAVWEMEARKDLVAKSSGLPTRAKRHRPRMRVYLFVYRDTDQPEQNARIGKLPSSVDFYRRDHVALIPCSAKQLRLCLQETAPEPRPGAVSAQNARSMAGRPLVDLAFGFLFRDAVTNLDATGQFLAMTSDHVEIVVGQLAPLGLRLTAILVPLAFDHVPIHDISPWLGMG